MILNLFDRNKAVTEGSPAVLVSVVTDADDSHEAELSLAELRRLCETAGAYPAAEVIQNRHAPDARTVIGSGKNCPGYAAVWEPRSSSSTAS